MFLLLRVSSASALDSWFWSVSNELKRQKMTRHSRYLSVFDSTCVVTALNNTTIMLNFVSNIFNLTTFYDELFLITAQVVIDLAA